MNLLRLSLVSVMACACGGSDSGDGDPAADASASNDAANVSCPTTPPAVIGRCVNTNQGPCSGPSNDNAFAALAMGEVSPLVVGFQGATMMPIAVRATGIEPDGGGDPALDPEVRATLTDTTGQTAATYQNGVPFIEVVGEPGTYEMLDVYLIFSGDPTPLVNQTVTVTVSVTDRNGVVRCGELDVTAGPTS